MNKKVTITAKDIHLIMTKHKNSQILNNHIKRSKTKFMKRYSDNIVQIGGHIQKLNYEVVARGGQRIASVYRGKITIHEDATEWVLVHILKIRDEALAVS